MATRELLHVGFVIEAGRLYPVLRLLEQAKAYNVEVRVFELGGEAPAADPTELLPKRRNKPGAGRPAGPGISTTSMRERVLDLIIAAGPDGAKVADVIKAIGPTRRGGVYQAANFLMNARKIERTGVGVYRLVNGADMSLATEPAPAEAPAPVEAPTAAKFDKVLAHLKEHGQITTTEIRDVLGVDKNGGDFAIKQLIAAKAVRRISRGVYARI